MPGERVSMRKIREVLRLRFAQGLSQRAIGVSLDLSSGAVNSYLGRARMVGLSWPLADEFSDAELEHRLKAVASQFPEVLDVHDFVIKRVRGRLYVSCHCTLSDNLSLSRVHDIQTELEIRFKQDAPELFRVLIHPEPSTDNRR